MQSQHIRPKIIANIFSKMPFTVLEKITQTKQIFPYYHLVSDDELLHVKHLYNFKSIKQFNDDIDFLAKRYIPIGLSDLLDLLKNERPLPRNTFLLTFDDGFREIYDNVAPILLARGIPATFFLNSDFIDNRSLFYKHKASILVEYVHNDRRQNIKKVINKIFKNQKIECREIRSELLSLKYNQKYIIDEVAKRIGYDFHAYLSQNKPYLTTDQINTLLKQGFTIGAHSIDHPDYSLLSLQEQLFQTLASVKYITEKFCLNYHVFSFPHSDRNLSKEFFLNLYSSGNVDISFGNSRVKDDFQRNIQRINFERSLMPADKILAYEFAKNIFKNIVRKKYLPRS